MNERKRKISCDFVESIKIRNNEASVASMLRERINFPSHQTYVNI